MHFVSRGHIISYIEKCPLRRSILRALDDPDGSVEHLGGFLRIPPGSSPGFIVDVTSKHGRTWHVAVCLGKFGATVVRVVEEVPWGTWVGNDTAESLYQGDNPDEYKEKKIRMQSERTSSES